MENKKMVLKNGLEVFDWVSSIEDLHGRKVEVIKGKVFIKELFKMSNDKNVRAANPKSLTGKAIVHTLFTNYKMMPFYNRGITCFILGNETFIIDGGTTSTICKSVYESGNLSDDCKLNIEIFMADNLTAKEISNISAARNTNTPPADFTFANACGVLDVLKQSLKKEYADKIEFRQNEVTIKKGMSGKMFLMILNMLDVYNYKSLDNPQESKFPNHKGSYSLKPLIDGELSYDYMQDILNDIIVVYNKLEISLTKMVEGHYNELKGINRFLPKRTQKVFEDTGKIKLPNKRSSLFLNDEYRFTVYKQIFYVFFSGLRANIRINPETKKAYWIVDVCTLVDDIMLDFWTSLCKASNDKPGGGMDVLCTVDIAKDLYMTIQQYNLTKQYSLAS